MTKEQIDTLFSTNYKVLFAISLKELGREWEHDAQDVLQDFYLALVEAQPGDPLHNVLQSYNGEKGPLVAYLRRWLRGRAQKKVQDNLAKARSHQSIDSEVEYELSGGSGTDFDISDEGAFAAALERKIDLKKMLAKLPDDELCVVYLHHIKGLSFTELSRRYKVHLQTIVKRHRRGMTRLQNLANGATKDVANLAHSFCAA